jgi:hypothetical protein
MKRSRKKPPSELLGDESTAERLKRPRKDPGLELLVDELMAELKHTRHG